MPHTLEPKAIVPLPMAAEMLSTTPQELLILIANQEYQLEHEGTATVPFEKLPTFLFFFADRYKTPVGIPVVGPVYGAFRKFIFILAAKGSAELPPPFCSPPQTVKFDDVFLQVRTVLRFRDLMATTPPPVADHHPGGREARKGGRPASQLYLGIEVLYLKKLAAGETALLQAQAGPAFMEELRRAVNGPEVCENVKVYIPKLERRGGRYRVHVADPPEIDGRPPKSNEKPNGYTAADVSKIMHKLRRKHPLE